MSTVSLARLLRAPLDRQGPLPLHEQLRSSIEIAIISGDLADGDPLPSVRRLSKELGIAPSTVVRVYRDLLDTQLIKSVPQRGFFVTTNPEANGDGPGMLAVRRLIDEVIDAAVERGVAMPSFLQLVVDQVRRRQQGPRQVAVVGHRDASLAERVECVAEALADLPIKVTGLSFQELEARNESESP